MQKGERYNILETLGTGGFGSVYKAHDSVLHRDVAVKRLNKGQGDDDVREQLLKEARVLAALKHPNIVSIYDVTSHADFDEIVMELAVGVTLDALMKRHLLALTDFKNVASQLLSAIGASHEKGVLHCDLKPENVMLCLTSNKQYEVKVYDFGMSQPVADSDDAHKLMGSIYVMAPELFSNEKPSAKSDIYALGCIFYYLLTGVYPFQGDTSVQVMAAHIQGNYTPLAEIRPDLPQEILNWIDHHIQCNKEDRFSSSLDALAELQKIPSELVEKELTLSTSLELSKGNSRIVRPISLDSLAISKEKGDGSHTTVFLSNSINPSSPVRDKPALPDVRKDPVVKSPIEKGEQVPLPEDAEWYFTSGDKVKGPVNIEQLKILCLDGRLSKEALVWHSLLGDWVAAESCLETLSAFDEKERIEQDRIAKELAQQQVEVELLEVEEKKEKWAWLGVEVYVTVLASIITLSASLYFKEHVLVIYTTYLVLLAVVGLSRMRIYQLRKGTFGLSFVIPLLGDLYYAIKGKNSRMTLCFFMVFFSLIGLSLVGVAKAKTVESYASVANDAVEQSKMKKSKKNTASKKSDANSKVVKTSAPKSLSDLSEKKKGLEQFSGTLRTLKDLQ